MAIELVQAYGCPHPYSRRIHLTHERTGRRVTYCLSCGSIAIRRGRGGKLMWMGPGSDKAQREMGRKTLEGEEW